MSLLDELCAIDIRDRLPRASWQIGTRSATTSLTWHYNGPEVASEFQHGEGLIFQLASDTRWQMRPGWGGTVNGAPHIMYHLVFAADGTIYQTADLDEILWHCAHQDGNAHGLALHFPLGGSQQPTPAQLAAAFRASDAARARFGFPLDRVVGHLEWKHATACPGVSLMQHLRAYRAHQEPAVEPTPTPAGLRRFQISPNLGAAALVRQGPGVDFAIAGRMKPGTIIFADADPAHGYRIPGEAVDGNTAWVHMARVPNEQADLGFVSETLGVWLD